MSAPKSFFHREPKITTVSQMDELLARRSADAKARLAKTLGEVKVAGADGEVDRSDLPNGLSTSAPSPSAPAWSPYRDD